MVAVTTAGIQKSVFIPVAACTHQKTYFVWIESRRPGIIQTVQERHEVCRRCGETIGVEPLLPRLAR
jgi:hypothetical protein